eukprot:TRINITY_DN1139_c0_g2_i1.p1 TRINITY_DN1139_c0_g2~~TRINITY_DN1139_c0_g2_i1.p1  ORF type:complete len:388 (-),score=48.71 TRINITY_DN1139_c0_g2_i1:307-1470(-)
MSCAVLVTFISWGALWSLSCSRGAGGGVCLAGGSAPPDEFVPRDDDCAALAQIRAVSHPAAQLASTGSRAASAGRKRSEILSLEAQVALGVRPRGASPGARRATFKDRRETLPTELDWCNKDGKSYCTASMNQHIPQYCGSCWAFASVSALQDRIKIARSGKGVDIQLSPQHLISCGGVGSCNGGSIDGPYQWLYNISASGTGISYETSASYVACSPDSQEGFCPHVDTSCNALSVARTCGGFSEEAGDCTGLSWYPNATISAYGSVSGKDDMMAEISARGPIACGIDAEPLLNYNKESGVITAAGEAINHVVSVVGWGQDPETGFYWRVRNSWGEYWGEMGFVRVGEGALHLENWCAWAEVKDFTAQERDNQISCHEGGDDCAAQR